MARTHSHRTLTALVRGPCANAESWRGTPPHCAGKRAAPRGKARAAPAAAVDHPLLERAPPQFGDALRARRELRGGEADLGSHLLEREEGGAARNLQVRLHRGARARLAAGSSPCAARAMWLSPRQSPTIPPHHPSAPVRCPPRPLTAPPGRRPPHPPTHPPTLRAARADTQRVPATRAHRQHTFAAPPPPPPVSRWNDRVSPPNDTSRPA